MTKFSIDPAQSRIDIEAKSSLHPIHGSATGVEGHIEVEIGPDGIDLSVTPKAHIELPVERLSSGSALQDMEMRRRVEAKKYPVIVAEPAEVKPLDPPGRYRVWGDLTFHGVTRRIPADVTAALDGARLTVEGGCAMDVRAFNVTPPRLLGLQVHPDVKVRIRLVAERAL